MVCALLLEKYKRQSVCFCKIRILFKSKLAAWPQVGKPYETCMPEVIISGQVAASKKFKEEKKISH